MVNISVFADNEKFDYTIDNRIVIQEGLSQGRILCIIEDQRGFMWFGTADGLNRYDGYDFKIYQNILNDSTSLPNNIINSIVEDSAGNIWIGTNDGLTVLDPYSEIFQSFTETDSLAITKGANIIRNCVIDKNNNIWYNTAGYGIYKINPNTLIKTRLKSNNQHNLSNVNTLYIDSKNTLWLGTFVDKKVTTYDIDSDKIIDYTIFSGNNIPTNRLEIATYYEDATGKLWLSLNDYEGRKGGLYYIEKNRNNFLSYSDFYSKEYLNHYSDRFNTINSIVSDSSGNIWFSSVLGGLYSFSFGNIPKAYYTKSLIKDSRINKIYNSKNGLLWIGTNGYGIEISTIYNADFKLINSKTNNSFNIQSIRAFTEDKNNYWVSGYYGVAKISKNFSDIEMVNPSSYYCLATCPTNQNFLYLGSESGGLNCINKQTNKYSKVKLKYGNINPKNIDFIFVIKPIADTLVLLGTLEGLYGFNPNTMILTSYPHVRVNQNDTTRIKSYEYLNLTSSLKDKTVRTIYLNNTGNILIGYVRGGIGKLNIDKKHVENFDLIPNLQINNNYNPINCIYNDKYNNYWIATNNALVNYNTSIKKIKIYTQNDGLPNNHIYSILPDENDNIWLSTNNGLSCYSLKNDNFTNYNINDGLQSNEFNTGAYYKANNGMLFFGGINGFNYFNPEKIQQNKILPKIVITDFTIDDKQTNLSKHEIQSKKIIIQPSIDNFSIKFAGLSYINSKNNKYKYRIAEFNTRWVEKELSRTIIFNGMDPGTYNLELLASNNHGVWLKKPYILTIEVLPTFIQSIWFKIIIAFAILLVIIFGYKYRLKRITNQKEKLEKQIELKTIELTESNTTLLLEIEEHKTTAENLEQSSKVLEATTTELRASNTTKDKFLSIMAHDIINPLGVILGFSDLLVVSGDDFTEKDKASFISTINTTAKSLNALIGNLLQWSRVQNGTISPLFGNVIVLNPVNEIVSLLKGNIEEKNIHLQINIHENLTAYCDSDMLSTILRNLLSNAIKFTPENGNISINAMSIDDKVEISIIDDGVGISEDNIKEIVDSKNQITTKGTNNEPGTGLGLVLVQDFITLNNGKFWIESVVDKGSEFCFNLPKEG